MAYIKWKDVTIVSAFRATVAKYPNRVMYVNASLGTEWTYSKACRYVIIHEFAKKKNCLKWNSENTNNCSKNT